MYNAIHAKDLKNNMDQLAILAIHVKALELKRILSFIRNQNVILVQVMVN